MKNKKKLTKDTLEFELIKTIDLMDETLLLDEQLPDEVWNSFYKHIQKTRKLLGIIK